MSQSLRADALNGFTQGTVTTTVLFMHGLDNNQLVSSIDSNPTATTYALTCAPSTTDCGLPSPYLLLTVGPSTMHYSMSQDGDGYADSFEDDCTIFPSVNSAICKITQAGMNARFANPSITTLSGDEMSLHGYADVTVTTVLEGAGGSGGATTTSGSNVGILTDSGSASLKSSSVLRSTSSSAATSQGARTTSVTSSGSSGSATGSAASSSTTVSANNGSRKQATMACAFVLVLSMALAVVV